MENSPPVYTPCLPLPSHGYIRTFEAEIDYLKDTTLRIRGVQTDYQHTLEYDWLVRFPDYTILRVAARQPAGEVASPQLLSRCTALQGAQTGQGFTRAAHAALGELPGHWHHLALAIDMARVSLQAFPVPKGDHERFAAAATGLAPGPSRVARMAWERDRVEWSGICNSCYAYRDESVALFAQRPVSCFNLDLASPEPGQHRFFWRTKRLRIAERENGSGFSCRNDMNDTFHQLGVSFDIEADGAISAATSHWQRLAYEGICEDAQTRTPGLIGKKLDKGYARLLAAHVGGRSGCSHLFDLSVDCVRFFEWPD